MGEVRGAYNILVGKREGRRPLGRPRHGWEDNIKMDLREIGFGDVDWIHLAQDRDRWQALVNTIMNLRVPFFISSLAERTLSFLRRTLLHGVN
jgi:hypothetical protein